MKTIIITGGGTAGHVMPSIALIPYLQLAGYQVHYLGMADSIEESLISSIPEVVFHRIRSGKLRRYFSLQNLLSPFQVFAGYSDAKKIIKEVKPELVFSKGGYVGVPVVAAAKKYKVPVLLHECDFTPGLANKLSMRFASKILVSFEDTLQYTGNKGILTGTPIRAAMLTGERQKGLDFLGFSGEKPILLCMGGSQGAKAINVALRSNLDQLLEKFDIVHLCGEGKVDERFENVAGYKQFEYISEELPDIFACTTISLSRAGANSVFELLTLCIPSLLVPLPLSASRGDQLQNAAYFVRNGFSDVLFQEDITQDTLRVSLFRLYEHRNILIANMQKAPNKDGTQAVLDQIYAIMGK